MNVQSSYYSVLSVSDDDNTTEKKEAKSSGSKRRRHKRKQRQRQRQNKTQKEADIDEPQAKQMQPVLKRMLLLVPDAGKFKVIPTLTFINTGYYEQDIKKALLGIYPPSHVWLSALNHVVNSSDSMLGMFFQDDYDASGSFNFVASDWFGSKISGPVSIYDECRDMSLDDVVKFNQLSTTPAFRQYLKEYHANG